MPAYLGQHFLYQPKYLNQIIESANLSQKDLVLEIGAGTGSLTEKIIKKAGFTISVEIDQDLAESLKQKFKNQKNIKIIQGDFLKIDFQLKKILQTSSFKNFKILGNLPYYITGKILRKITELRSYFGASLKTSVLLVQKEVGEKICHLEKNSILSLSIKIFGKPKLRGIVPSQAFTPPPQVDSVILKIDFFNQNTVGTGHCPVPTFFFRLIKIGFSAPRKMLKNNLKNGLGLSEIEIKNQLKKAGILENARAEDLKLKEWMKLLEILNCEI